MNTTESASQGVIERIQEALQAAACALRPYSHGAVTAEYKSGGDPVTAADRDANDALKRALLRSGEGWLSEETADDLQRLAHDRLWIVDPIDGTREFVAGIPEWCVSVAWVVAGKAEAGAVWNPATGETFIGSRATGLRYNGARVTPNYKEFLEGAIVLASRSEVRRGEWERFYTAPFTVRPTGSVAYKLARVAAGLADATWTMTPKHEWDVAAGVALVQAAGAQVWSLSGAELTFNQRSPLIPGLVACGPALAQRVADFLQVHARACEASPGLIRNTMVAARAEEA